MSTGKLSALVALTGEVKKALQWRTVRENFLAGVPIAPHSLPGERTSVHRGPLDRPDVASGAQPVSARPTRLADSLTGSTALPTLPTLYQGEDYPTEHRH